MHPLLNTIYIAIIAVVALGFVCMLLLLARQFQLAENLDSQRSKRRAMQGLCRRCEYNLHMTPGPLCPECGTPIPTTAELESMRDDFCCICGEYFVYPDELPVVEIPESELFPSNSLRSTGSIRAHKSCWINSPQYARRQPDRAV